MNWDLIKPWASKLARNGLQMIGASLASHGFIQNGAGSEAFIGAGMTLAGLFWDWWVKAGADQTVALLKKLTGTLSHKDAVKAATVLPTNSAVDTASKSAIVKSVTNVLIAAFLLSFFLAGTSAMAQARFVKPTGDIVKDIQAATAKPSAATSATATAPLSGINFNTIGQKLQALAKDVIDKGISDLSAASTDAQNHNDLIAKPCWDAQSAFLKQLPAEWQTPPSDIGPALAIQISRDLINSITGNDQSSLKVACAALIGDQLSIINQTLAIVGITGIAGLPAGL